jgi:histidyl-tRNA synthetase
VLFRSQFGIESIGRRSYYLDYEIISISNQVCLSLGINNYVIKINSLGTQKDRTNYIKALKEYFAPIISTLCPDCQARYLDNVLRIIDCKVDALKPEVINAPKILDYLCEEELSYFSNLVRLLDLNKIPYQIDKALVRGLDYYSGTVFEIVSTDNNNSQNALGGGGCYTSLVKELDGPDLSGIGLAFGIERLLSVSNIEPKLLIPDFFIVAFGKNVEKKAYEIISYLRTFDIILETALFDASFKSQFKKAINSKAKYLIILGDDEINKEVITIKNTLSETQVSINFKDVNTYLKSLINL